MSIGIKLDTNALASLIDKDETFKLSIQQAILQNIADRYIKTADLNIASILEGAANQARDEILSLYTDKAEGRSWGSITRTLNERTKRDITGICREYIESTLGNMIREEIGKIIETYAAADIRRRAQIEIDRYTNDYIQKQIKDRFDKAMKAASA